MPAKGKAFNLFFPAWVKCKEVTPLQKQNKKFLPYRATTLLHHVKIVPKYSSHPIAPSVIYFCSQNVSSRQNQKWFTSQQEALILPGTTGCSFCLNKRFSPKTARRKGLSSCFLLWFARSSLLLEACKAHADAAPVGNTGRRYFLMIEHVLSAWIWGGEQFSSAPLHRLSQMCCPKNAPMIKFCHKNSWEVPWYFLLPASGYVFLC